MSTSGEQCLFSAPFDFLPAETLKAYQDLMPVKFHEVWLPDGLEADSAITVWVPNPGQNFTIEEDVLTLFPSLKVIATPSTGRNHINEIACKESGVAVYSLQDDQPTLDSITASAEFTFLLLLNALRRLDFAAEEVTSARWRSREGMLRGNELAGKRVGLVGLGRNGGSMARYCQAFNASVAYYDPYVTSNALPAWPLEAIFRESDAVVICCALTPETTDMVGFELLSKLKERAVLVNTSRGEVIVEADLAQLLHQRPDVRAGIDVLRGEVTDTHHQSPLLEFHRRGQIVVTPHIAGVTIESQSKAALGALNAVHAFFGKHPL